ncbi:alpha/beta hydrolase [Parasalinivibrio latis]|uniref:alpha/beta hydrolase n=1 Tax=Parasalinivibrio latis TaxID=2952610 RepID=UPI0030E37070
MSSKIYFKNHRRFSVKRKAVSVITGLHYLLAPKHAKKTARKLFLTPVKGRVVNREPAGLIKKTINTSEGELMTYQIGNGPMWLLSHGWSGSSSQFYPLMEHIANAGFTALAYDQPAHGESEGTHSSLPSFVTALNDLLGQFDHIEGLVTHSMAGAGALESTHPSLSGKPVLLIAPVLNYRDNLYGTVRASGYSMRLFDEVVKEVEDKYSYPIFSIDPFEKLKSRRSKVVIVHDRHDRFANFGPSMEAAGWDHVHLVATEGLGHGRIMKSQALFDAFDMLALSAGYPSGN